MTRPVDDNLLLELIEGELSPEDEARVRKELAEDPALLSRVEAMMQQREMLRSDPEPEMPSDLLAGMEARLARPMLMDDGVDENVIGAVTAAPGASAQPYRAKPKSRSGRLARFAVAAGLMLTLTAGVWVAATLVTGNGTMNQLAIFQRGEPTPTEISPVEPPVQAGTPAPLTTVPERLDIATPDVSPGETAAPDAADGAGVAAAPETADEDSAPDDAAVAALTESTDEAMQTSTDPAALEFPALSDPATRIRAASQPGPMSQTTHPSELPHDARPRGVAADEQASVHREPAQQGPIPLDMMLAIRAADRATIEQSLVHLLHAIGSETALSRNFSYNQARQLEQRWLHARARSDGPLADESERLRTNIGSGEPAHDLDLLAYRALQQLGAEADDDIAHGIDLEHHIAGPRDVLPAISQQLNLSRNGATHTVTLPVGAVALLLERLNVDEGFETSLVPLDGVRTRILPGPAPDAEDAVQETIEEDREQVSDRSDGIAWGKNLPRLRELLIQLETMEAHQLLHLPIRFETDQ